MPFNPSIPVANTPADADQIRDQLNALKALIDGLESRVTALEAQVASLVAQITALANLVPIGGVIPWFKDTPGVPPMPANFVECNGQMLVDPESLLDGQFMPDANTGAERFIRGNLVSGLTGGIATFATASADNAGVGPTFNAVTTDYSPGAIPIPPFITAVYIIRVK